MGSIDMPGSADADTDTSALRSNAWLPRVALPAPLGASRAMSTASWSSSSSESIVVHAFEPSIDPAWRAGLHCAPATTEPGLYSMLRQSHAWACSLETACRLQCCHYCQRHLHCVP